MADAGRARKVADRIKVLIAANVERIVKDPDLGFVTITDVRVTNDLPDDFDAMRAEARAEGYRMLDRLAADWMAGETRFEAPDPHIWGETGREPMPQGPDDQHPAGPLFAGGEFAEADIVGDIVRYTGMCGTDCSGSHTRYCC